MIYFPVRLIDERQVHPRYELNFRSGIGIIRSTGDLEAVDAILMHGLHDRIERDDGTSISCRDRVGHLNAYMPWAYDGAVPIAHQDIVANFQAIGT